MHLRTTALTALPVAALLTGLLAAPAGAATRAFTWGTDFGPVTLTDGWSVDTCEPSLELACVTTGDEVAGLVRWGASPLADEPQLREDLRQHGRREALRRAVADFHRTFEADREDCGYDYEAGTTRTARVAGTEGVRTSFVVRDAAGRIVERTVLHLTVARSQRLWVNASAVEAGGCLAREGGEFTVRGLAAAERAVDRLAAVGRAPSPQR